MSNLVNNHLPGNNLVTMQQQYQAALNAQMQASMAFGDMTAQDFTMARLASSGYDPMVLHPR